MGILNRLLNWGSTQPDYADPDELRAVWDRYCEQWPDNNDRFKGWKPASILPAPKWAIKRALKLCYAEWPEPIDWTIFRAFFMEFVDLALHLPQERYDAIEKFRKGRINCCGRENKHDPLLDFRLLPSTGCFPGIEDSNKWIIRIRDGFRRSKVWDPVDANDHELDVVRQILLESTTEFFTLIEEWRFYILSIGRDQFVKDS
jgi:hypothetical protein